MLNATDPTRIEQFLSAPYHILDILPCRVPEDAADRYAAIEQYFLRPARLRTLRRTQAELLLILNCYFDMTISFEPFSEEIRWETNPAPEDFAARMEKLPGNGFLRVLFPSGNVMIDFDGGDAWATVYYTGEGLPDIFRKTAEAKGLFIW